MLPECLPAHGVEFHIIDGGNRGVTRFIYDQRPVAEEVTLCQFGHGARAIPAILIDANTTPANQVELAVLVDGLALR